MNSSKDVVPRTEKVVLSWDPSVILLSSKQQTIVDGIFAMGACFRRHPNESLSAAGSSTGVVGGAVGKHTSAWRGLSMASVTLQRGAVTLGEGSLVHAKTIGRTGWGPPFRRFSAGHGGCGIQALNEICFALAFAGAFQQR